MVRSVMHWRPCRNFPDYDVSDCGEVRRNANCANQPHRRLRGYIDMDGYIRYAMRDADGVQRAALAHRLVAEAFIGPPPSEHHQVAHRNGSRTLNIPDNLRWALCHENEADREAHGTRPKGQRNPKARLTDDDVRYIRRRYPEIKAARGDVSELDRRFGITRSQVIRIVRREAWRHVA